ncbi:hypothetical protein CFP65_4347 [Kitasatospora sp. MMS16-BH015]|uniref:alpha/beta hydrolase n=1 Tax=Kitasatospora sp. MMS16-BH015 TaxID=2018025 RepID=UPI000CA377F7|nr:alpha/beta hydrolase [Kitasatospora sp. MMS16-BH015]AUG79097.1 hypothetical protein CFP65_4347 [Kitasatospora sp. MMS16-BH015]
MSTLHTVEYGPSGRLLDIHRPAPAEDGPADPRPTVLLWHGRGPDERDVLGTLAQATAALGVTVLVPDWRPDAPDQGMAHLLESVTFARRYAAAEGTPLVLAGWSLGGKCAVSVALEGLPGQSDWRPRAVVSIAGGFTTPSPTTGTTPLAAAQALGTLGTARRETAAAPVPVHLIHGSTDEVVPAEQSRTLYETLTAHGHPVTLDESPTDHAGIVLTEYSPARQRCLPAPDHRPGHLTARLLARYATEAGGRAH